MTILFHARSLALAKAPKVKALDSMLLTFSFGKGPLRLRFGLHATLN